MIGITAGPATGTATVGNGRVQFASLARRLLNLATVISLVLCAGSAVLWARSHRQAGSLYAAGSGVAVAADWVPGEISFWLGRVDRRCNLSPVCQSWGADQSVTAFQWFEQ